MNRLTIIEMKKLGIHSVLHGLLFIGLVNVPIEIPGLTSMFGLFIYVVLTCYAAGYGAELISSYLLK